MNMNVKLSQTTSTDNRPESSRGNRVILDEQVQPVPEPQASASIPAATWYWLGAVALVAVAVVVAASFYYKSNVNDRRKSRPANDETGM